MRVVLFGRNHPYCRSCRRLCFLNSVPVVKFAPRNRKLRECQSQALHHVVAFCEYPIVLQ